jgi:glucose/arabinose dehydrogenase
MNKARWIIGGFAFALLAVAAAAPAPKKLIYVKKGTRQETVLASLKASGLLTLRGPWHYIGPFDNTENQGFDTPYPPEKEIDLKKTYSGKDEAKVGWKEIPRFRVGEINNLKFFANNDDSCIYLYHEIDAAAPTKLPVSLGSDDGLIVWLNGKCLVSDNTVRAAAPDQDRAVLRLKKGKNRLLVKVCNVGGEWAFYIRPEFPPPLEARFQNRLNQDFPGSRPAGDPGIAAEAKHYRLVTVPIPDNVVLEVGGLAFRPDGKLLACTRRGDVWLISHPDAEDPEAVSYKRFATGLHEPLGMVLDGKGLYVVQRPELTRLVDRDGDGVADLYETLCDRWGVSGDYHEFAFGPARDKQGNFFITLNVGFAGGHQSKAPWRGWCVKITPQGKLIPYAVGLRSPNGINFSPDGDLFYCDNQGEWVATCKMHHVRPGEYYGHPAGLRWVSQSPYKGKIPERHASGMMYDGQAGRNGVKGMPPVTPPCIWFPYGRMGQSASEPRWDTTGGKFGPFAGQCFVGDQTRANVMRVALEKVKGRYQGACFPFRSGFQCGINRLVFGPDGSLYAGQTNRGWGSVGGKPYGLQRLVYTGVVPFEIYAIHLTKTGFDLTFTKPLDPTSASRPAGYNVQSFTHYYWSTYGSPEVDRRAEKVRGVTLSADRRKVSLAVTGLRPGRVYEVHLDGIKSAAGEPVLHPEGYYTLNQLP